ncbi:NACHT domain-containing protein [Sphaerisporangium sp. B11E5]|uniref:NACHT domain-containing protein n=1 Tax=Sphaerisporangium sp. B11E5 TaxID=3153563 RepID=UPI00325F18E5
MRTRRGKAWSWGVLALVTATLAVAGASRVLPELKAGDVDPLGALISTVSLAVSLVTLWLTFQALRLPAPTVTETARALALAVKRSESAARRQLLGDGDTVIDVHFALIPAPGDPPTARRGTAGARSKGRLARVVGYYRELRPRRLVVTGASGAGKTVLAVELILGLLDGRADDEPVPVRVSAALLDTGAATGDAVEAWLVRHLMEVYGLKRPIAHALVAARLVTPVIDGLDEMDAGDDPGYDSRAGRTLRALDAYQDGRAKGAVVLTCRSTHYEALEQARIWAAPPARVEVAPVSTPQARAFLTARVTDPARWHPVFHALRAAPRGPLAQALSTPWRLTLTAVVYEQRTPDGAFVRDPADLTTLDTPEAVRDHLLDLFIPAAVALSSPPGGAHAHQVHRWLATLARYLHTNSATRRALGGRPLSGTDLVLHELWPLAGNTRPRLLTAALTAAPFALAAATFGGVDLLSPDLSAIEVVVITLYLVPCLTAGAAGTTIWPEPVRVARLRTAKRLRGLGVALAVGLVLGLTIGLMVGLTDGLAVGLTGGAGSRAGSRARNH